MGILQHAILFNWWKTIIFTVWIELLSPYSGSYVANKVAHPTEVTDYREELVLNLSPARALAAKTISKEQQNQRVQYDQHISSSKFRVGD